MPYGCGLPRCADPHHNKRKRQVLRSVPCPHQRKDPRRSRSCCHHRLRTKPLWRSLLTGPFGPSVPAKGLSFHRHCVVANQGPPLSKMTKAGHFFLRIFHVSAEEAEVHEKPRLGAAERSVRSVRLARWQVVPLIFFLINKWRPKNINQSFDFLKRSIFNCSAERFFN